MKHILFIFFDQLRFDALGANGNPYVKTPHIDELAGESIRFTRCFTPSPVCVPARLSLLAGQYPARTGNSNNNPKLKYEGTGFYASITEAGYDSFCAGKLHHIWDLLGNVGFKKRVAQEPLANDDYFRFLRNSPMKNTFDYNGQRSDMYYVPQVSQLPAEYHPTTWIADESIKHINACDPEKENVFIYSSIFHPHPPFSPPAPWNKLYRDYRGIEPHVPDMLDPCEVSPLIYERFTMERLGISKMDLKRLRNFYYACVSFADYQVSRIIAALKEKGMYDDTLIVLSSDHGEMLGDYNTVGKRTMYDGACKVPLLIRVPGHGPEVREDVCSLVDLAPTLLSWAGIDYDPAEFDGIDLLKDRHTEVFSQYNSGDQGVYMIADDTDKLIYCGREQAYFYFKNGDDDRNLFKNGDEKVGMLKAKLDAYVASDRCDIPKHNLPRNMPFGVAFKDDPYVYEEEIARVPAEYGLKLTEPKEIKETNFTENAKAE